MPFKEEIQTPMAQALRLNLLFLLLCLGIGGIHYGSMDDFFMSLIVTGGYGGEFDAHTLFVNGAYAYFLKPFYALFPDVGWYFLFELLFVFASFNIFVYYLLKQVQGKMGLVIAVLALACLAPDFYLQLSFTQCAASATMAGILLVFFGNQERRCSALILAIIFFIVGVIMRREGFLLGVPFLVFVLLFNWLRTRKFWLWTLVALLISGAIYVGLHNFNQNLFRNNEYSYYLAYQGPRAIFGDGADYDEVTVSDELEERGLWKRDFQLLRKWVYYDTDVLGLDSLRPIVDVVNRNRYELNWAKMPVAVFFVVAKSFFKTNAWCWATLCLLLFFMAPRKAPVFAWGTLALMAICLGYLLCVNRVVYHVETGVWLYAIASFIPFARKDENLNVHIPKNLPYLVVVMALGCFIFAMSSQRDVQNNRILFGLTEMPADWKAFSSYAHSRPNDVFLLPFEPYKAYATYNDVPYKTPAPEIWNNVIPLGYWNINHPGVEKEMAKRGVKNPIRDIIKENVFVLDDNNKLRLEEFYLHHYGVEVAVDTVQSFGIKKLLKYSVKADNP